MRILTIFCASIVLTVLHSTPLHAQDDSLFNDDTAVSDDQLFADDNNDDELFGDEDTSSDEDLFGADDAEGASSGTGEIDAHSEIDAAGASHLALFTEERYPSANTCKTCHETHYKQWAVSQHSYAQLSPVYMAMQNRVNQLTSGTNGDFCIRCHTQVGMNLGESTSISNLERHPTSRESITCVVCHRLDKNYGKVSGRIALVEGDLLAPVFGPQGNEELERVLDNRHEFRVVTDPDQPGRKIHTEVGHFPALSTSGFCGTCHDVNLHNGFRLEEAFSEYKNSPAAEAKQSCQDCHMGKEQGVASGYDHGPAATVGGVSTKPRKLTNHFFAGPDYSVIHPGIFPHNSDAAEMATMKEWLEFDVDAGWGTDEFEDSSHSDIQFPARWQAIDDRYDAREIIDYQLQQLEWATEKRLEVLRNGYGLGELTIDLISRSKGIKFHIDVHNLTDGHNVPTGFDAERLVWLDVSVSNGQGEVVFRSGDLDPNGDLRDAHSQYVHNRELPLDTQLFNLQSKFVTQLLRGGEREQILAVNYSVDPLPFIRPDTRSTMLHGQPAGARKHRRTIPPRSKRTARYSVPAGKLKGSGPFKIELHLKSAMVPVNLVAAVQDVGFDYGMSAKELADNIVAGHHTLSSDRVTVELTE